MRKAKLMSAVTASGIQASLGKRCDFVAVPLCKAKQEEEGNPAVTPKTLLNAWSSACPIYPEFAQILWAEVMVTLRCHSFSYCLGATFGQQSELAQQSNTSNTA